MKALIFLGLVSSLMILSCKTVDLEPRNEVVAEKEPELTESELRNMEIELRVDELMKEGKIAFLRDHVARKRKEGVSHGEER